jgi:hypothetical protein
MSAYEGEGGGSDYDEDAPDQEEIMIDNELDDDVNIQNDNEVEEKECRLKINQVVECNKKIGDRTVRDVHVGRGGPHVGEHTAVLADKEPGR